MENQDTKYDLEERTSQFGLDIIELCKIIKETTITRPIISQLIRSATSIGANYMEANGASSRKDFANKIYICKKEVQETKHWLRMLIGCDDNLKEKILVLADECRQLILIFQKISSTTRQNANK